MADRYWIGDDGNTNDTAHWAASSGGAGGETVPTSSDNVFFDANSFSADSTVTVAANFECADIDCTGLDQAVLLSSSVYTFSCYGSFIGNANLTITFTGTAYFFFKSTGAETITMGGATFDINRLYFDGVGGSWTNQDAMDIGSASYFYLYNGTWDTNGYTIDCFIIYVLTGTKSLTLGSSTVNCGYGYYCITPIGLTFDCGTSSITTVRFFYGGGETYYNVALTYFSQGIYDENTFNNLTFTYWSRSDIKTLIRANQTINGVLTITGYNATDKRVIVASETLGTARTLTCNGSTAITNCDFRDITFAGSAIPNFSTGTGGDIETGDCGGNSGATFRTGEDRYYYQNTGNYHDAKWYSATGGGGVAVGMPLPQDTAVFDADSFNVVSTVLIDNRRIGTIDASAMTSASTLWFAAVSECYGSIILSNILNLNVSSNMFMYGRGNHSISLFGKTWTGYMQCYLGTYTFLTGGTFYGFVNNTATVDINDCDITSNKDGIFFDGGTTYLGNGTLTNTGNLAYFRANAGAIIHCENSTLKYDSAGTGVKTFVGNGKTFNNIWFSGSSNYITNITGGNTFNNIKIDAGCTVKFTAGTTTNFASLTAIGTSVAPITITSVTATTHTLNYTGTAPIECQYLNISYSTVSQVAKLYAGATSTNSGNNTNWIFGNFLRPVINMM